MENRWKDLTQNQSDPLTLRVHSSRLLGEEPQLVLHGGGNTSVKIDETDAFGEKQKLIYVKGSGWDLATIEKAGFAPVKLDVLLKMARFETMADSEMVRLQRAAMTDPNAPNPSVEAILHALIPFRFVDHTHADAVIAVSNSPNGEERLKEIYGDSVLYIPYVMPGFILARKVFEMTQDLDWSRYKGMVLLNHGIFSFADNAKDSYDRMIELVTLSEKYLEKKEAYSVSFCPKPKRLSEITLQKAMELARIRSAVSKELKKPCIALWNAEKEAVDFSSLPRIEEISSRGPLTPDHVIQTKRTPLFLKANESEPRVAIDSYTKEYKKYFAAHTDGKLTMLDTAPRFAVWQNEGLISFSPQIKTASVISDLSRHTIRAIQWAEKLGKWEALPSKDIFEVEYWELEQAKLKKAPASAGGFQGQIALVTGAAQGIGRACVEEFVTLGACVIALDIAPEIETQFAKYKDAILGVRCDVTDYTQVEQAIRRGVRAFGGLDIVVTNAGSFPKSAKIKELSVEEWEKTMKLNVTSHFYVLKAAAPFLELGWNPNIVVIGSKNVPAPGPGASAYSAAKAALTQLSRVAALEMAEKSIRVNVLHPNAVFDTGIWTDDVLDSRAKHYGLSIDEYKKNNLLHTEITSKDVAKLAATIAGANFSKTTGAQIPIDGGNDRVI